MTDRESSTPSLLKIVAARLSEQTVIDAVASDSDAILRIVSEWILRHLSRPQISELVNRGLEKDIATRCGMLRLLMHPDLELTESVQQKVVSYLQDPDLLVRRLVVAVIARRFPEQAAKVLQVLNCRNDFESLRLLCRADDPALILPMLEAFGYPEKKPPPTIGLLVTPTWLAEHASTNREIVQWLANECGYCEGQLTGDVIEMLSLGLSFVDPQMTASGPADQWVERVRTLSWQLLPEATNIFQRDEKSFDLRDPFDVALFLAAVRDTDRQVYVDRRRQAPWKGARGLEETPPVCFHASARHVRRLFLSDTESVARELSVPESRYSEFFVDHARCRLEPTVEQSIVADRAMRTKWQMRRMRSRPARELVIGRFSGTEPDSRLSPGAQSVQRLAEEAGMNGSNVASWLMESEGRWKQVLVPVGIELQIPIVDANLFGAWKDALAHLEIPSPNRPEFGGMLEAAFHPARSFHAMLLGPLLLHRLGAISHREPQDVAMHISLQGDLGDRARYLAFPQLFIHPSERMANRPDRAMTRVMSKGLVKCNADVELLDGKSSAGPLRIVRTEFRMFRVFSNQIANRTQLELSYAEDIVGTQLIGSALLSDCQQCRHLAESYCQDVERFAAGLPAEFSVLLSSNFYESTGDPRDEVLMNQLPVFRAWSVVRRIVRERNLRDQLDREFRELRSKHVNELRSHLFAVHQVDLSLDLAKWLELAKDTAASSSGTL